MNWKGMGGHESDGMSVPIGPGMITRAPTRSMNIPLLPEDERTPRKMVRLSMTELEVAPTKVLEIIQRLSWAGEVERDYNRHEMLIYTTRLSQGQLDVLWGWVSDQDDKAQYSAKVITPCVQEPALFKKREQMAKRERPPLMTTDLEKRHIEVE